ncbi:CC180-like protein [Mya arenaria]|uniref:CC180-like protein n=1 Tax=Mya arenaria TaxID=6604 RepID=A0ABY7G7Y8_MYAAR|nr:CC180-like protein [Mya arenaria]
MHLSGNSNFGNLATMMQPPGNGNFGNPAMIMQPPSNGNFGNPAMMMQAMAIFGNLAIAMQLADNGILTAKDLPGAISEVLQTKKGTTFYVVTVAGEHGIPAETSSPDKKDDSSGAGTAFMTELSSLSGEKDGRPDYIRMIDIPEKQASERSSSVVVAKCEELNSELDLRLHLHKPRARRAEYDVHNVRAAELVMHSERVSRHCKGITQALTEVRERFMAMTQEHNELANKFRQEIEALEVVFINATKASKVFSDGGNFCPEEIEEYRKRLDKMANNVDKSEGAIMSDLEDMESKRLEQATKVAMEFEDRFKSHLFDLIFMEKIARWLTNTQVKIKAEVAISNSQAQALAQHLADIDRRIDACEPGDREKMKSSMSTNASSDRGKHMQSRHGPSPASASESNNRKVQSAALRRTSKPAKYEKRTVIFGNATEEEDNTSHFLGTVRKILREALDGLFASSEMYYRQKGARPVTRPQALQETFELCADVIIQKLQSYYQQADEYHNQCLQELRSQLSTLEKSVAHIPSLVVSDLLKDFIARSQSTRTQFEDKFKQQLSSLREKQKEHEQNLRPNLGHPHQEGRLAELCRQETERHNQYLAAVDEQTMALQNNAVDQAKIFLESLARLSENQLLQYDNMLVNDDVEKGRLPSNDLVSGDKPGKVQLTASVTTAKTTLGHSATMKTRDEAYQDYKRVFENTLQEIDEEKQRLLVAEQRWMDSWNTSVEKVKMLY